MNEWISVNDKLPELNQRVLVYAVGKIDGFIGEHTIDICERFIQRIFTSSPGLEMWSSPYQYFHTDYEITHWMPLPENPTKIGHWIFSSRRYEAWTHTCSECGQIMTTHIGEYMNYCPKCGVKMGVFTNIAEGIKKDE